MRFEGVRVLGDPSEAALRYAQAGADELLYVDAVASLFGRNSLSDLLRKTCIEVFIPITAAGGVRSVEDAAALLSAGADKVAVNTAALERPELITELAEAFGRQCVVASIQARRIASGSWEAMKEAGRERTGRDVCEWIKCLEELGAGEILLTSVDQDGTCSGPDHHLINVASSITSVPLVVGGGFSDFDQIQSALMQKNVSAVSLGASLHSNRLNLASVKKKIEKYSPIIPFRSISSAPTSLASDDSPLCGVKDSSLSDCRIGVINYGMGNQQSLINALETLGAEVLLTDKPSILASCDLLTLPGVGAFPKGMDSLRLRGLDVWLRNEWVALGKPLLGICLGMQMLFESSSEFKRTLGLGFVRGHVKSLPSIDLYGLPLVLPHMGWNRLINGSAHLGDGSFDHINQYFVHTFAAVDVDPSVIMFYARYGHRDFVAAVRYGSVVGFQFHPERSGSAGLRLLSSACSEMIFSFDSPNS
ncbi:imidazole glycerol phosphate synthase/ glutamineamidotransferase subunit [Synechococcus sp. NOUM97013]|nr:imidazole glycerol phosphate synthase/ glutamineamidotransferase subunit [Synechococcus sp. NOUM97013]